MKSALGVIPAYRFVHGCISRKRIPQNPRSSFRTAQKANFRLPSAIRNAASVSMNAQCRLFQSAKLVLSSSTRKSASAVSPASPSARSVPCGIIPGKVRYSNALPAAPAPKNARPAPSKSQPRKKNRKHRRHRHEYPESRIQTRHRIFL